MSKASLLRLSSCLLLLYVLSACSVPEQMETSAQLPPVNQRQATPILPAISFPRDQGEHNDLTEWWYYTGHLQARDKDGKQREYGFELVIFRVSRSDLPVVYPAHFAISDINRGQFHYDQQRRTKREDYGSNGEEKGWQIQVGNWSMQGLDSQDHLRADMNDYAIDLNLTASKPPVLQNGNGLISYGIAGFSYYYSRTHLQVTGSLIDHQQALQVTGLAWMDHQWGNFLTLGGSGWDWYSLQLSDNIEMMIYCIHSASGSHIATYATIVDEAGKAHQLLATELQAIVTGIWKSPTTGITYPSRWRLDVNSPHMQAVLTVEPLLKDQELVVKASTGNIYWEGAVSVEEEREGGVTDGQGYVELTGYS